MRKPWSRQKWMEIDGKRIPRYSQSPGKRYSPEVKAQVVQLKREGYSYNQICEMLDIGATNRAIRRWLKAAGYYDVDPWED